MNKSIHDIIFTDKPASVLEEKLLGLQPSRVAVLVDENTKKHCLPFIEKALPHDHVLIEIESGERHKNLNTCIEIWKALTNQAFDRKGVMVNLGGGVIGDMGGFCAATYKRGIRFINMPTTLLAQVDASIGGKLGIDFDGFKNHIGMFREPDSVIISTIFMDTLIDREIRSGFAEVVKHALISDSMHFEDISRNLWHKQNWHEVVPHSVTIKENVVIQDPQEQGLRKTLNFGHTIGHAIETHYLNHADNPLLHGEAIAMGMIAETLLSSKKCGLSQDESQSAISYLMDNFPLERIPEKFFDAIINLTIQDKKNRNGKVLSTLLQKIGQCAFDIELSKEELYWAINEYNRKISAK